MGRKFVSKNKKYRQFSTVTDTYVTKWLTQEETRADLALDKICNAAADAIQHELKFPNGRGYVIDGNRTKPDELEEIFELDYSEIFEEFNKRVRATGATWVPQITLLHNEKATGKVIASDEEE